MTEVINFRKARKLALQKKQEVTAAENRTRFGRTKNQRRVVKDQEEKTSKFLDQHRLAREDEV